MPVSAQAGKYSAILMDAATGRILHSEAADQKRYPASLTKMMTLYLAFDALKAGKLKPGQKLKISSRAASQAPSKLGLVPGKTISVENAILALTTKSANDAAVVLAEAIAGSEKAFAERMTRKARQLGMTATVFQNASGLPNFRQVTTARDIATLSRALIRSHSRYYHYFSRTSFSWNGRTHTNHNRLLGHYPGADGLKTGYIDASGFNLAASAIRGKKRLICVVFGGPSGSWRDEK
ncbi:MAG: D-alanyl-D-alanine carboxypeptidase, partial [Pseudomonadota bacterium]|nr:D-alanyl-D-alanine carboxypeptidase [Pseudomonadota bacterium]